MGEVYRAEDQRLRRTVALKFLPAASAADALARERFMREARAASALDHPNICTIHDIDETAEGLLFITMACYDGETLRRAIDRGPLRLEDAIGIARQVAEGMAKAHDEDITHRDLHPGNILITSERMVKILDFGLATLTGADRLTKANAAAGTLAYMAPEQIRGEDADARSDIWAFGVVLFEMLTGRRPFGGDHPAALIYAIANTDPEDLALARKDIPGSIVHLCRQCLRKHPGERPQTMHEVLGMLGHWPFEISGVAGSVLQRIWMRFRLPILAAAAFLIALVLYLLIPPTSPPDRAAPRVTIGILPFTQGVTDASLRDWPLLAQRLLAADLTGYENAGIVDPLSLNSMLGETAYVRQIPDGARILRSASQSGITMLVDGTICKGEAGPTLRATLIQTANGEALFAFETPCINENSLMDATTRLARQIMDFIDVQVTHLQANPEMRSWMQRRPANLGAAKALLQAAQLIFAGASGSEELLRTAISLDSTFLTPRIWLIPGLMVSNRQAEAHYHLQQLRRLEPSASPFEKAMINWAAAYVANDLVGQLRHLNTALQYSPDNNILLFNRARIEYLMEDYEAATLTLQRPVASGWAYPPAHYLLGASYSELGKYHDARTILERSLGLQGVYPDTYALLAALAARDGNALDADRYETRYLALARSAGVSQAIASATLAGIYLTSNLGERALRHYDVAVTQDPHNAGYHEERGEAFEQCGDTISAEQCYARALSSDSLQFIAHFKLGRILDRRGDTADALRQYMIFLRHDSTSGDAQVALARVAALQQLTSPHRP